MKTNWLFDIFMYLLGLCFNIVLLLAVAYLIYVYALKGFAFGEDFSVKMTEERPSREVEFILEEETPAAEVAQRLEELGVIRSQYLFRLELFLKDSSKTYKAGTYLLDESMNNTEINVTLRAGSLEKLPDNVITIPEGYTIRDIATLLEDRELIAYEDFLEACDNYTYDGFTFLAEIPERPRRLEGYLFPDTYFFSPESTANEIIYKLVSRFDEIFTYDYRARAKELDMTVDDIVIIASLIEKEVRVHAERPLVSQVIYNRLDIGMPLQIDATIQYALDKRRDRLMESDLQVSSPYNTYLVSGLPEGPIASPGADCIYAALYPEEGRYIYYVLSDAETGEHYFTHDHDAFMRARDRYLQSLGN